MVLHNTKRGSNTERGEKPFQKLKMIAFKAVFRHLFPTVLVPDGGSRRRVEKLVIT